MREPIASRVLRTSLYIIFVAGILCTVTLPFMLDYYTLLFLNGYYLDSEFRKFIIIFIISVAIPGLWIIMEMILMLRSIPRGPFIIRNVNALRRIGVVLFIIAALFLAKCFFFFTFLTMGCVFLFSICGFFAFTLSNLFSQAVTYKEENDLTI